MYFNIWDIFFLHNLKETLKERKIIKNCNIFSIISAANEALENLHSKVSCIDLKEFPEVIYTMSYQDGVIHAFERFMQNYKTGEYNRPGAMKEIVIQYTEWIKDFHKDKNFWDESYYKGYINGLILIDFCEADANLLLDFPFLYIPNSNKELFSYDVFMEELKRFSLQNGQYQRYAQKFIKNYNNSDIVIHHPPY